MTIKTLEYIHGLLLDDVSTHKAAAEILREARNREADLRDADKPNAYAAVSGNYDIAYHKLRAAKEALEEFELKDW